MILSLFLYIGSVFFVQLLAEEKFTVSSGERLEFSEDEFSIVAPVGWKVYPEYRGFSLLLESPEAPSSQSKDKTYRSTIQVMVFQEPKYIDEEGAAEFEDVLLFKFSESSSVVKDYSLRNYLMTKMADGSDAVLYYTEFKLLGVAMMQAHLLVSSSSKSYLLTFTDLASHFDEGASSGFFNVAWGAMTSFEVPGKPPVRYNFVLLSVVGGVFLLVLFLFFNYRRRANAREFSSIGRMESLEDDFESDLDDEEYSDKEDFSAVDFPPSVASKVAKEGRSEVVPAPPPGQAAESQYLQSSVETVGQSAHGVPGQQVPEQAVSRPASPSPAVPPVSPMHQAAQQPDASSSVGGESIAEAPVAPSPSAVPVGQVATKSEPVVPTQTAESPVPPVQPDTSVQTSEPPAPPLQRVTPEQASEPPASPPVPPVQATEPPVPPVQPAVPAQTIEPPAPPASPVQPVTPVQAAEPPASPPVPPVQAEPPTPPVPSPPEAPVPPVQPAVPAQTIEPPAPPASPVQPVTPVQAAEPPASPPVPPVQAEPPVQPVAPVQAEPETPPAPPAPPVPPVQATEPPVPPIAPVQPPAPPVQAEPPPPPVPSPPEAPVSPVQPVTPVQAAEPPAPPPAPPVQSTEPPAPPVQVTEAPVQPVSGNPQVVPPPPPPPVLPVSPESPASEVVEDSEDSKVDK